MSESYEEVDLKDKKSINLLEQFYTDIYIDCFPNMDERESFDNLLKYLEETKRHTDYKYHILLMKNAVGEVIGGAIFDYFKKPNVGGIEFIAIKKSLQSTGLGSRLYHRVVSMFEEDAHANHQKEISHIFCEIEDPIRNNPEQKEKIYLDFWTKQKYKRIGFSYLQPALSENQKEVDALWLIVNSKEGESLEIDARVVEDFVFNYIKYAMSIPDPAKHPSFQKMKKELNEKGKLRLSEIKTQGGNK